MQPTSQIRALHPDGTITILPDAEFETLQAAVGGYIEYFPEAFHGLTTHEVVTNDDYHGLPVNLFASRAIGLDLSKYHPIHGVVVLVPLEQNNHAEREHQQSWFALAEVDPALVGYGAIIDHWDVDDK
jgi:hypothetical protein